MAKFIAICFFGITRSLQHTIPSIERNIITPLEQIAPIRVYSHFFSQESINNPRSGESGPMNMEEHSLLPNDWICLEEPDLCLDEWDFETLKLCGDFWNDDFRSLRNLVHQQHSLRKVTLMALKEGASICVFCRPDLYYHDSLVRPVRHALKTAGNLVQLPYWQPNTGMNDRFAICSGRAAITAYGTRITLAEKYCEDMSSPLHSERLLRYALERSCIPVRFISARATRVRLDGKFKYEDFLPPTLSMMNKKVRSQLLKLFSSKK